MHVTFDDRVAVVTGSSGGIGLAVVRGFLQAGARVVTGSRSTEELAGLGEPERLLAHSVDLGRPDGPQELIERAIERFGRVDILVNNLGLSWAHADFLSITDEEWARTWEMNVMTMVRATRSALPGMVEQGYGSIVNISSAAARQPTVGLIDYASAKLAVIAISKALALQYGPHGIRVNTVSPGPVRSPAWERPGGNLDQLAEQFGLPPQEALDHFIRDVRRLPLGKIGEADEAAAVILFLASERASAVTGADYSLVDTLKTI